MTAEQRLLSRLARPSESKIVLLVLDGCGDLRTPDQPRTALELADTPHLDRLAASASQGRLVPVVPGVTPGSGPGHLGLFGYDPAAPEADIGRGALEAFGLGLSMGPSDVAARGNFATADAEGRLTDRRAGRISTEECRRLCASLGAALEREGLDGVSVHPGEAHRFVLLIRRSDAHPGVSDTDPQKLGVPPLEPLAEEPSAEEAAAFLSRLIALFEDTLAEEPQANRILLRGLSRPPRLPPMGDLYGIRAGAFAGYPLYRGVAAACGMEVVPCGRRPSDLLEALRSRWSDFDYLFVHVKATDQAGEDGDLEAKVRALEEVDTVIPQLLDLRPDVLAVTGDHSTPVPMKGHSWHPVPVLLAAPTAFADHLPGFNEAEAARGSLGTIRSQELIGLLLAHAGRLHKFGA